MPALTDRLPLGTELEVSPACIGMVEDPAVIGAAYEAGINFFFLTADMHWPLYEMTRRGLADLLRGRPSARDEIVVAVVAYVTQPEFCWAPFEEVLWTVPELDRVDVTIAGGSYAREIGQRLPQYARHREQAYLGARAVGASFHDRAAASELVTAEKIDIAYIRYNPGHDGAARDVYAKAKSRADGRRCLLYNFKSTGGYLATEAAYAALGIGDDFWRPHITDYYRFAFTQPAVDGVLCSPPSPAAIGELADALANGPLSEDDNQYLIDLAALSEGRAKLVSAPASSSASRAAS